MERTKQKQNEQQMKNTINETNQKTKRRTKSPVIAVLCAAMMICATVSGSACVFAGTDDVNTSSDNSGKNIAYVSSAASEQSSSEQSVSDRNASDQSALDQNGSVKRISGNVRLIDGVTNEMCNASYWTKLAGKHSNDIIMDHEEISEYNYRAMNTPEANMNDITNTAYFPDGPYNAAKRIEALSTNNPFKGNDSAKTLWINGKSYDNYGEEYFNQYSEAFKRTCYQSTSQTAEWAVGVKRTPILELPVPYEIGYSIDDVDNENCIAIVDVNEPIVIRQTCEFEGHKFYYVFSSNNVGWVDAEDMAITTDRNEWLDAWQVDLDDKDFIVVTQDKITLEASGVTEYSSELNLTLGTILKMVPDELIPEMIGERGTYNNYVVYLPTRDETGKYVRKMALISQHCSVSEGFLDHTQKNVMDVAFSCLGNRYGWRGTDNGMNCTLYSRLVYKCMGFEMPGKSEWQVIAGDSIDVSNMSDAKKQKLISSCPAGTLLSFPGFMMTYTGTVNNTGYVLSSHAMLCEPGSYDVKTTYTITLNPLNSNRANRTTWLHNIDKILCLSGPVDINKANVAVKDRGDNAPDISVTYQGRKLYKDINYTAEYDKYGNIAVLYGKNNFDGVKCVNKSAQKIRISTKYRVAHSKQLKKKARYTRSIVVKKARGKVEFSKISGSKNLYINSRTGKIRVKKNTKKGFYKIKVKATAAEGWCYKKGSAVKTIRVCVK